MKLCPSEGCEPTPYWWKSTIKASRTNACAFFWGFVRAWLHGWKEFEITVYLDRPVKLDANAYASLKTPLPPQEGK